MAMLNHTRLLVLFAVLVAWTGRAEARPFKFLGPHPIAARYGGGYCYIDAPHMHAYGPDRPGLYQQVGDEYVFTADPTPFGYEGDRHLFYGHHPVVVASPEPVYCYLEGPHYHAYAPIAGPDYRIKDGVAFYVGPFSPAYVRMRPHRVRVVNAEYRPYVSFRPAVEVAPPEEWHGEVYVAGPSVEVHAPGVQVYAPGIEVHAPGVFIPPPPPVMVSPPSVTVTAPGVVVAPPGPVFVGPGPRYHRGHDEDDNDQGWHRERGAWHDNGHGGEGHWDNGRHNGWGKHGRGD
jgi:hypothetical protein